VALTLVRHTRPDVAEGVCYGRTDLALAAGTEAAFAEVLAALEPPTVVVSSPLRRCRLLAQHIARACGVGLTLDADFTEMDFGTWEGLRWDAIGPEALDAWAADFLSYDGHGGESVALLRDRVARGLAAAPNGAVIVTHAGVIKAALALRGAADAWAYRPAFGMQVRL